MDSKSKIIHSSSGENIYLPDVEKKDRLKSPAYLEKIANLDLPITFIVGELEFIYLSRDTSAGV